MKPPADEDERTTDVGMFNFAASYRAAAAALDELKLKSTHPHSPTSWLYCHAIELYLKSHLRAVGHSVSDLRKQYGHNLTKLGGGYEATGGILDDEDKEVIELLAESDQPMRAKYIVTGAAFSQAGIPALARTANSLHESVRMYLKGKGRPVR